jgi:7-cyano-7-deazaguanine synthase
MVPMNEQWKVAGSAAVVLLSGGQDSTTALAWAVKTYGRKNVHALSVDYGQRHSRELTAAVAIAKRFRVPHRIGSLRLSLSSSLTGGVGSVVVPHRNSMLLDMAAGHAKSDDVGADVIVIGACEADAAGFMDCRPEFLLAWEKAARLAHERPISICAPLLEMSKAATVRLARELNAWEALALSWTCYEGGERPCGECTACIARARGFAEAGEIDPALASEAA